MSEAHIRIATSENEARFHHYASVVDHPSIDWLGRIDPPYDKESLNGVQAFIATPKRFFLHSMSLVS